MIRRLARLFQPLVTPHGGFAIVSEIMHPYVQHANFVTSWPSLKEIKIGIPVKAVVSRIFSRSIRIDSIEDIYRKLSPFILTLLRELHEHKNLSADPAIDSRMVARRRARLIVPQGGAAPRARHPQSKPPPV